jgi:hypothetical protein
MQDESGGAAERSASRELGPDDWDGRRIRRPLQRASVEARRRSSFKGNIKGDNAGNVADLELPQPDGGQGSGRQLGAAPANGVDGRSNSGGVGQPVQGMNGGGPVDDRPAGHSGEA